MTVIKTFELPSEQGGDDEAFGLDLEQGTMNALLFVASHSRNSMSVVCCARTLNRRLKPCRLVHTTNLGYQASFAKLASSNKNEHDPFSDIKDTKAYLVDQLHALASSMPGQVGHIASIRAFALHRYLRSIHPNIDLMVLDHF